MDVLVTLWAGCSAGLWAQLLDPEMKKASIQGIMTKIGSTEAFHQQPLLLQANAAVVALFSFFILVKVQCSIVWYSRYREGHWSWHNWSL